MGRRDRIEPLFIAASNPAGAITLANLRLPAGSVAPGSVSTFRLSTRQPVPCGSNNKERNRIWDQTHKSGDQTTKSDPRKSSSKARDLRARKDPRGRRRKKVRFSNPISRNGSRRLGEFRAPEERTPRCNRAILGRQDFAHREFPGGLVHGPTTVLRRRLDQGSDSSLWRSPRSRRCLASRRPRDLWPARSERRR